MTYIERKRMAINIIAEQMNLIASLEDIEVEKLNKGFKTMILNGTIKIQHLMDGITKENPELEDVAESAIRKYYSL